MKKKIVPADGLSQNGTHASKSMLQIALMDEININIVNNKWLSKILALKQTKHKISKQNYSRFFLKEGT